MPITDLSLVGGFTVWGDSRSCTRVVHAYVPATRRHVRWKLGTIADTTCSGKVLHTRCGIVDFLHWGVAKDGEGSTYRTYRGVFLPRP